MNPKTYSDNEALSAVALKAMPLFQNFSDMDMQRLLELMQKPCKSIDSCISKGQLQTLCKQLLAQNLAFQTAIRNLEIKIHDNAQVFDEAMQQVDTGIANHTEFEGLEALMMVEAKKQDEEAKALENSEAGHAEAVTAEHGKGSLTFPIIVD